MESLKPNMNFTNISELFNKYITKILDSQGTITLEEVEKIIKVLKEFSTLSMNFDQANLFMHDVVKYIVFLNNYSKCSKESELVKNYIIRKALGVFMYVVDKTETSEFIAKKIRKIIDVITPALIEYSITKEFLRLYSHFMDTYSPDLLKFLAAKHNSFPTLNNLLKDTCDIETQAVIVEIVLKFCKHSNSSVLSTHFVEVIQLCNVSSIDTSTIYQNIRMVLDHLNRDSTKMFSINCSGIELNSRRVIEFEGAQHVDDIWLDINLTEYKISFFCTKKFAELISTIGFYTTSSSWEIVSLYIKDILQTNFYYNVATENLIISFIIKTSKFNLFVNANNNEQLLEICVSRYSDRFLKLVNEILPKIFPDLFSAKSLHIPLEKDDVSVANEVSSTDSRSVTEYCKQNKKLSTIREQSSPNMVVEADNSISIVSLSDDQSAQCLEKNENRHRGLSFRSKHISEPTETDKIVKNETITKRMKCFISERKKSDHNKSTSPVSFTDSVLGRKNRSTSKCFRTKVSSNKNLKISTPCKTYKKLKIFKIRQNTELQPSTDYDSSVSDNPKKYNQEETNKSLKDEIEILESDEVMREPILNDSLLDTPLNNSNLKVADWLQNKVDYEIPFIDDTEETNEKNLEFCEETNTYIPPSISARNSEDYFNMAPENQLKLMMPDEELLETQEGMAKSELVEPTTSGDLLNILNSQENDIIQNVDDLQRSSQEEDKNIDIPKTINIEINNANINKISSTSLQQLLPKSGSINQNVADISTDSSNIPLSVLAEKIRKTEKHKITENLKNDINNSVEIFELLSKKLEEENPTKLFQENLINKLSPQLIKYPIDKANIECTSNVEEEVLPEKTVSTKTNKCIDEVSELHDVDKTLELDEILTQKRKNNTEVLINTTCVSNISKHTINNSTFNKRKLYNPGDYSHINNSVTDDNVHSVHKSLEVTTPNVINIIRLGSSRRPNRKSITKNESKQNKKSKETKSYRKKHREDSCMKLTKQDLSKKQNHTVFSSSLKMYLQDKIVERKFQNKMSKKLVTKKKPGSSSSSSSMEPFGNLINNIQKKRKADITLTPDENSKRLKEEIHNEHNANTKIHIISDVVIQPGKTEVHQPCQQSCCGYMLKSMSSSYLHSITHVSECKPELLRSEECTAILKILERCKNA